MGTIRESIFSRVVVGASTAHRSMVGSDASKAIQHFSNELLARGFSKFKIEFRYGIWHVGLRRWDEIFHCERQYEYTGTERLAEFLDYLLENKV